MVYTEFNQGNPPIEVERISQYTQSVNGKNEDTNGCSVEYNPVKGSIPPAKTVVLCTIIKVISFSPSFFSYSEPSLTKIGVSPIQVLITSIPASLMSTLNFLLGFPKKNLLHC